MPDPEARTVTYKLVHDHDCGQKGEFLYYRPDCRNGVEFYIAPKCIEQGVDLTIVTREVTAV